MSEFNFSPDLSSDEGRVSYGIGRQLGGQLRDNPPPGVDLTAILAGLTDAFSGQASQPDLAAPAGHEFSAARQQAHLGAHWHRRTARLVQHNQRLARAADRKHHDQATAGVGCRFTLSLSLLHLNLSPKDGVL